METTTAVNNGTATTASPAPMITLDPSTAYRLCAYVDGSISTCPEGWTEMWKSNNPQGNNAMVFQMYVLGAVWPECIIKMPLAIFAVAIQGTKNAWDILEDMEVENHRAFPPISGAYISEGSHSALNDLLKLEGTTSNGTETLESYLGSLVQGETLLVTGHSLGGNLSSVLAPWIACNIAAFGGNGNPITSLPASISAITFAAPTAGDETFATFLNNQGNYQAYFNQNDVVSNVWSTNTQQKLNLSNISQLFPAPGPNPAPASVVNLINNKIAAMEKNKVSYTQTNGTIFTYPPGTPPQNWGPEEQWVWEMGYQHNYAYCVTFLGENAGCKPPGSDV